MQEMNLAESISVKSEFLKNIKHTFGQKCLFYAYKIA